VWAGTCRLSHVGHRRSMLYFPATFAPLETVCYATDLLNHYNIARSVTASRSHYIGFCAYIRAVLRCEHSGVVLCRHIRGNPSACQHGRTSELAGESILFNYWRRQKTPSTWDPTTDYGRHVASMELSN